MLTQLSKNFSTLIKCPYNEIDGLINIGQLIKWKKKNSIKMIEKKSKDECIAIYTSLIAKCVDMNEFEYGWKLFEITKKLNLNSIFVYSTMLQLVHKQYINYDEQIFDRNAVKIANNLKNEMKYVYNIEASPTFYGILLKIYVQLNEYELALIDANKCLEINPENIIGLNNHGSVHIRFIYKIAFIVI